MVTLRTTDSKLMENYCVQREPFRTHGNMWAERVFRGVGWTGRLPDKYKNSYWSSEYAIYSYNTPIAWYGPSGWTMPEEKYSITTSRHQGRLYFIKYWIRQQSE